MEKTLQVELREQRIALLEEIAKNFEFKSRREVRSNEHTYNDCAVIAKTWLMAADTVRRYK